MTDSSRLIEETIERIEAAQDPQSKTVSMHRKEWQQIRDSLSAASNEPDDTTVDIEADALLAPDSQNEGETPVAWLYEADGFADAFSKSRIPMKHLKGAVRETPLYARSLERRLKGLR